LSHYQVLKPV